MRLGCFLLFTICNQGLLVVTTPCTVKLIDPSISSTKRKTWNATLDLNKNTILFQLGIIPKTEFQLLYSLWNAIKKENDCRNQAELPEIVQVTYDDTTVPGAVTVIPMGLTLNLNNEITKSFQIHFTFLLGLDCCHTSYNFEIHEFLVPGLFYDAGTYREISFTKSMTQMNTADWAGLKQKCAKILVHPRCTSPVSPWFEVNIEEYNHSETELRIKCKTFTRMPPDEMDNNQLYTFVFANDFPNTNRYVIGELNGPDISIFEACAHNARLFPIVQSFVEQKATEVYQGNLSTPDLITNYMTTPFVKALPRKGTKAGHIDFNSIMGLGYFSVTEKDPSSVVRNRKLKIAGFDLGTTSSSSKDIVLYTIEFVRGAKTETIVGAEINWNKNQVRFRNPHAVCPEKVSKPSKIIRQPTTKSLPQLNAATIFLDFLMDPDIVIYYSREFTNQRQRIDGTHKRQFLFHKPGHFEAEALNGIEYVIFDFDKIKPNPQNWNSYILRFPGCTVTYCGEMNKSNDGDRLLVKNITPGAISVTAKDMKGLNVENLPVLEKFEKYPGLLVLGPFPYFTVSRMGSYEGFPWKECTVKEHKLTEIADHNDTRYELEIYIGPVSVNVVLLKKRYPISNPIKGSRLKQIYGTWMPKKTLEIRELDHSYENTIDFTELQKVLMEDKSSMLVCDNEEGDSALSIFNSEAEWSKIEGFAGNGVRLAKDEFEIQVLTIVYRDRNIACLSSPKETAK